METIEVQETKAKKQLTPEQKAKKLANDKRLKELHKKEAAERVEKAGKFLKYLKDNKMFEKLSPEYQDFVTSLAIPPANRSITSLFEVLFGASPKVGQSITLMEAFQKSMKGKAQIDHFLEKKWKPAGIIVEYEANPEQLNSKYIIKALPNK